MSSRQPRGLRTRRPPGLLAAWILLALLLFGHSPLALARDPGDRIPVMVASPGPRAGAERRQPTSDRELSFLVKTVVIDGNTILSPEELRSIVAAHEGCHRTLKDLRKIARELEKAYHDAGCFLAQVVVPPQLARNGEIHLEVIEGRYGEVRVDGNRHYSTKFIRKFFEPAVGHSVVLRRPLERAILTLNRFPDLKVQSVFTTGKGEGTTDVVLKVADHTPVHVGLDYNNYGNRLIGRNRAGVTLTAGSLALEGDGLFVRGFFPFPSKSDPFVQLDYNLPVGCRGSRFGFQYASAATTLGQELAILDIRGRADIFGLTYQHPLSLALTHNSNLSLGLVGKSVRNVIFGNTPVNHDELREVTAGLSGTRMDRSGRTLHYSVITAGLGDLLGGTKRGSVLASRVGSGDSFVKFDTDVTRIQQLDSGQYLLVRVTAQTANVALPVAEQYALGGPDSVRGYVQTEFLGDRGFTVSGDYRYTVYEQDKKLLQLVGFVDSGYAALARPQTGELASRRMTGAGVGVRGGLGGRTTARIDVGFPVRPTTNVLGEKATLYAQVSTSF